MRRLLLLIVLAGFLVGTYTGCSGSTQPESVKQRPNNDKRRGG
jgi:hypothetical protein